MEYINRESHILIKIYPFQQEGSNYIFASQYSKIYLKSIYINKLRVSVFLFKLKFNHCRQQSDYVQIKKYLDKIKINYFGSEIYESIKNVF